MRVGGRSLRRYGGLAGIVVALSAGFGVAVGVYSLPDPQTLSVTAHVYESIQQRATGSWPDGTRVEVTRGAWVGVDAALSSEQQEVTPGYFVGVHFLATRGQCDQSDCGFQSWEGDFPLTALDFDPLLGSAHFSQTVEGCKFDVQWTTEGTIAPFENVDPHQDLRPWRASASVTGRAILVKDGVSVDMTACFGSLQNGSGTMSEGLQRTSQGASAGMDPQS